MNTPAKKPCGLCGRGAECDCAARLGPFHLTFADGTSGGSFVHVDLAVACLALLSKHVHNLGKSILYDRHGCPVTLPA